MELGMIGLGKMGANMAERPVRGGHRVVGFDLNPESVQHVADIGVQPYSPTSATRHRSEQQHLDGSLAATEMPSQRKHTCPTQSAPLY